MEYPVENIYPDETPAPQEERADVMYVNAG